MTPWRRELIFKCADGDERCFPIIHAFTSFYRCDTMLEWLIKHRITGKNLWKWVTDVHEGSYFTCARYVLTKVKRETELQPVIGGVDYIVSRRI